MLYTNDLTPANLIRVAKEAAAALPGASSVQTLVLNRCAVDNMHLIKIRPSDVPQARKVEVMRRLILVRKDMISRSAK